VIGGLVPAGLIASAGADSPAVQVLGSVTGKPSASLCPASVRCTYIPSYGLGFLIVPFDGTITSFSVNSGSAGGQVELRVLSSTTPPRFLNGEWTGAGTGPVETLRAGINTFPVNIPVRQGETIALDNDSGAPIFDNNSPSAQYAAVAYYAPALPDGTTAFVNRAQYRYSLLMSATVVSETTTTATLATPTTPPTLMNVRQSHRRWRLGTKLAKFAAAAKPPVGTTFRFALNESATVRFAFAQLLPGRKVNAKCMAQTSANRNHKACTRSVPRGSLSFSAGAGLHKLFFQGRLTRTRKLKPGTYTLTITATNAAGQRASKTLRSFTIVPG
jgi:hypothetical protein